jgi:hypothetical protein
VDLNLRHASARRASDLRGRRTSRYRSARRLAGLDALAGGDRGATRLRGDVGARGADPRLRLGAARLRGDVGACGTDGRLRARRLRWRPHVRAGGHRCAGGRLACGRRSDIAGPGGADTRGPTAALTVGALRRTASRRPTMITMRAPARAPVGRRPAVGVVAVVADPAPVPTGPVVTDPPGVGDPRVVVIPHDHQRRRRTPVVAPHAPVGVPEDERAVHVVVPAPGPVDPREGLDRLGVGVHVGHDHDLFAARHRLVADHLRRLLLEGVGEVLVLHVDVAVGVVGRRRVTGLVDLLLIGRARAVRGGRRRRLLLRLRLRAAGQRDERNEDAGDEGRSRYRHDSSVPCTKLRNNPGDPPAPPGDQTRASACAPGIPWCAPSELLCKRCSRRHPPALRCVNSPLMDRAPHASPFLISLAWRASNDVLTQAGAAVR